MTNVQCQFSIRYLTLCFLTSRLTHRHERREETEPLHTTKSNLNTDDLGNYEEDLTEQRIEGIETLVEQLSKTVVELNSKVKQLHTYTSPLHRFRFHIKFSIKMHK